MRRQSLFQRPRRGQLGWLDFLVIVLSAALVVLLADPFWMLAADGLESLGIGAAGLHVAGQLAYTAFFALGFVGVFYLVGRRQRAVPWRRVGLVRPKTKALWVGLVAGLAGYTVIGLVDATMAAALGRALVDNPRVFSPGYTPTWYTTAIGLIVSTAIVPFIEEFFFRGVVFGWLRDRIPAWLALGISALAFSAYHENADYFASLFVLGLILGWVYQRTKSLWPAVVAHGAYNLVIDLFGFMAVS